MGVRSANGKASSGAFLWRHRRGGWDLSRSGIVMGILNVTPDSFSDGGEHANPGAAVRHAAALEEQGAAIIDVGGESTRPGSQPVAEEEELRRVVPVVRGIRRRSAIVVSVDTSKAAVADAALREGADIINDVTAFEADPGMVEVALRHRAGVVLMHMQGRPPTMQLDPQYQNVLAEVGDFLRLRLASLVNSGMDAQMVALDPGIGFGKIPAHNAALLRGLPRLSALDRPLLLGVSRKSFLGWLVQESGMEARHWPGVAISAYGMAAGARIFRVHEPRPHLDALAMIEAIACGGHA
jgi:dihydropteroate synthase